MRKKGFVYTLFTIVVVTSLMLLLQVNMISTTTSVSKSTEKIRADEIHYLVEGIDKDIGRSGEISGRRALLSIINWEITNGTFTTTPINSINEAILNGTINSGDETLTLMENNTLINWMTTLETLANKRGITTDIILKNTNTFLAIPFSLTITNNASITARDVIIELAYKRNTTYSNTIPIDNLEDPYTTIKSYGNMKQNFIRCQNIKGIIHSSDWINGFAYVSNELDYENVSDKQDKILVTETISDKSNYNTFAGIVTEQNDIAVTSPYVFSVINATNEILNNSIIVLDNETIWLTNIINQPNSTCYFNDRNAPSFLNRLEGKDTPDNDFGISAFLHMPSLPVEMQSGSDTYVLDYVYLENLFD
ncbi:hypothetical protein GQ473_01855 [archaeon]|nr:hypothetical protein [archaeon]